ncbi:GYF domain-containing protein [Chitinimonas naiadis]
MSAVDADADFYLARGDVTRGPFTRAQIRAAAATGKLLPDDLIWRGKDGQRSRAEDIPGLLPTVGTAPPSMMSPTPAPAPVAKPAPTEPAPYRPAYMLPPVEPVAAPAPPPAPRPPVPAPAVAASGQPSPLDIMSRTVDQGPAEAAPKRKRGFFVFRHWRGELSLVASFWGIGLFCTLLVYPGITTTLQLVASNEADMRTQGAAVITAFVLSLLVAIWQWVGVWRSGSNYTRQGKGTHWGRVAQGMVVFSVLARVGVGVTSEVPHLQEAVDWMQGIEKVPQPEFNLLRGGTELELAGGIAFGTANKFRAYLQEHPEIALVHLNSSGGRISEAVSISRLIRERRINTYTSNTCVSACALAFLGGNQRYIGAKGRLGFHSAYTNLSNPVATYAGNLEQQEQMQQVGASAEFIRHAISTPPAEMWYPTREELLSSNVITEEVSGNQFAMSGMGAEDRSEASIEKELRSVPYADALAQYYPEDYARFRAMMVDGIKGGKSLSEIIQKTSPLLAKEILPRALKQASDTAVASFWRVHLAKLQALQKVSPEACVMAEFPNVEVRRPAGNVQLPTPSKEDTERELAAFADVIRSSATEATDAKPPFGTAQQDLTMVIRDIYDENRARGDALRKPTLYAREPVILCASAVELYRNILGLGDKRAANVMRLIGNDAKGSDGKPLAK